MLALIDVCLERTQASGAPPDVLTTRQLAEKIVEIYWPHTVPFAGQGQASRGVLRQNNLGQAEIVSAILRFRRRHAPDPSVPRWESRVAAPDAYERLVRLVEWKLRRREVGRYLADDAGTFDNRVMLKPNVGEYLLQLNSLLRPLIQRRWAAMLAELNRLEESQLEAFLFGADRTQTARIRAGLWEVQERRCFYCDKRIQEPTRGHVDHFIPWSRYQDDGLDNLVTTDIECNGFKSNSLAAADHVARWARRFAADSREHAHLADLAERTAWDRHPDRSLSVARGIYLRLPDDARLWLRGREFVTPDFATIATALGG